MKLTDVNGNVLVEIVQESVKWQATFIDGSMFKDPWVTALIIEQKLPWQSFEKELKKINIKGWWMKKIPIGVLIWFFTDGEDFWNDLDVSFDMNDAAEWWGERLKESLTGVKTLLDAIIAFSYFKDNDILQQIGQYVSHLREIQRRQ